MPSVPHVIGAMPVPPTSPLSSYWIDPSRNWRSLRKRIEVLVVVDARIIDVVKVLVHRIVRRELIHADEAVGKVLKVCLSKSDFAFSDSSAAHAAFSFPAAMINVKTQQNAFMMLLKPSWYMRAACDRCAGQFMHTQKANDMPLEPRDGTTSRKAESRPLARLPMHRRLSKRSTRAWNEIDCAKARYLQNAARCLRVSVSYWAVSAYLASRGEVKCDGGPLSVVRRPLQKPRSCEPIQLQLTTDDWQRTFLGQQSISGRRRYGASDLHL